MLIQSSWTQPIKANTSLAAERRDDARHCVMRDSVELLAVSTHVWLLLAASLSELMVLWIFPGYY